MIALDRIYRVEVSNNALYFLRVGSQFNLDRATPHSPGEAAAAVVSATGEALFRKHKQEELLARNPSHDPEALVRIHPHSFKLLPADIRRATFLPKKWFLSLFRRHFGRLRLWLEDGKNWEFHFEHAEDLRVALTSLPPLLKERLESKIAWDETTHRFVTPSLEPS